MCVHWHRWTHTLQSVSHAHGHTWSRTNTVHALKRRDKRASPITAQGYFPPHRLVLCQCASRRPCLAALMSCFFDRRTETDSVICTPAQTCLGNINSQATWRANAWERPGLCVLHFLGWSAERHAAGVRRPGSASHSKALCLVSMIMIVTSCISQCMRWKAHRICILFVYSVQITGKGPFSWLGLENFLWTHFFTCRWALSVYYHQFKYWTFQ